MCNIYSLSRLAACFVSASMLAGLFNPADAEPMLTLYIGSTAEGAEQGVFVAQLDLASGELSQPRQALDIPSAGFLAIATDGRTMVVVGRGAKDTPLRDGRIAAVSIKPESRNLTLLNASATRGRGPCYVSLDADARHALVANYGSGSVEAFSVGDNGRRLEQTAFVQHEGKSVNADRQEGPHAHSIQFDPSGRFAVAADLGTDQLHVYRFGTDDGSLAPAETPTVKLPPGSGPRHMAWHPDGRRLYVLNELSSTVSTLQYDGAGGFTLEETVSSLPEDFVGESYASEIQVHPNGRYLYAANRGDNSIATFAIDASDGGVKLIETVPCGGDWPRNTVVDPTGRFFVVANQNSDNVVVLRIDPATGKLVETTADFPLEAPMCVRFLPPQSDK